MNDFQKQIVSEFKSVVEADILPFCSKLVSDSLANISSKLDKNVEERDSAIGQKDKIINDLRTEISDLKVSFETYQDRQMIKTQEWYKEKSDMYEMFEILKQ